MNKMLKRNIFGLAAYVYMCMTTCLGYGWVTHEQNRSHVFCSEDGSDTEEGSVDETKGWLRDEGFRWKNSLNFKIEGVEVPGLAEGETSPDAIHQALSKAVKENTRGHGCAAGVSIIARREMPQENGARNKWQYTAHWYPLIDEGATQKWLIAIPVDSAKKYEQGEEFIKDKNGKLLGTLDKCKERCTRVKQSILQEKSYSCCEGQMIDRLLHDRDDHGLNFVERCIEAAKNEEVVLVVFHLHSKHDPCGKCTRMLKKLNDWANAKLPIETFEHLMLPKNIQIKDDLAKQLGDKQTQIIPRWNILCQTAFNNTCWSEDQMNLQATIHSQLSQDDKMTVKEILSLLNDVKRSTIEKSIQNIQKNLPGETSNDILKKSLNFIERTQERVSTFLKKGQSEKPESKKKKKKTSAAQQPICSSIVQDASVCLILHNTLKHAGEKVTNKTNLTELVQICDSLLKLSEYRDLRGKHFKTLIEISSNKVYSIKKQLRQNLIDLLDKTKMVSNNCSSLIVDEPNKKLDTDILKNILIELLKYTEKWCDDDADILDCVVKLFYSKA